MKLMTFALLTFLSLGAQAAGNKVTLSPEASAALYDALNVKELNSSTIILDGGVLKKKLPKANLVCTHTYTNGVTFPPATSTKVCEFTI